MVRRRLVLVRHAKTEQGAGADIDRRLTGRGHRDAAAIGRWLKSQDLTPDTVLVSPAARAGETWEIAAAALRAASAARIEQRIYDNTVQDLLDVVRAQQPETRSLVLVGHNPSIQALAAQLARGDPRAPTGDPRDGYPTSGIAVFDVAGDWSELSDSTARLDVFEVCRG